MRRALIALGCAATPALAQSSEDPRVLFAEGRYAAAAETFELRWQAAGEADDGVNAVVAWRTAGHYARAAALLARVRSGKQPPAGEAAETARALDERLATLTAIAKVVGPLKADSVIRVDGDVADRIGDAIVLDVGEHDLTIEQEGCAAFGWHGTAYPGDTSTIAFAPRCDQGGTLHVYLAGDPGSAFAVDGKVHPLAAHEADVVLEPGAHALHVASHDRPVLDEPIAIASHQTTAVRVRYPWRARDFNWILAVTGSARAGGVMNGLGLALTTGVWAARYRATIDLGSVMSDHDRLGPPGHPWFGASAALHVTTRPLWHGKLASHRLALDLDPLALRFDEIRSASYFGIRTNDTETRVRALSFLPLSLSADGPYVHLEIALWPISVISYRVGTFDGVTTTFESGHGYGSFLTIAGGWRL